MNRAEQLRKQLNSKFGDNASVRGTDKKFLNVQRVPTGLIELDIALGGGIPVGRVTMIYGPKSSGKSTLCELATCSFQQHSREGWGAYDPLTDPEGDTIPITGWIDVEGTYTEEHASDMGIDPNYMLISVPKDGEETIDIIQQTIDSGLCDLIVVDSLAAMTPRKEVDRELSEDRAQVGEHARLVSQFLRKLQAKLNDARRKGKEAPTILLINQERVKINTFGGRPGKLRPGGEAQAYATSVDIQLHSGKVAYTKDQQRNVTGVSYAETFFQISKNKTSTPDFSGRYRVWVSPDKDHRLGETDEVEKVLKLALQEGLLKKEGAKYKYAGETYKTQKEFKELIRQDIGLFQEVREVLLKKLVPRFEARRALEEINRTEETKNPLNTYPEESREPETIPEET